MSCGWLCTLAIFRSKKNSRASTEDPYSADGTAAEGALHDGESRGGLVCRRPLLLRHLHRRPTLFTKEEEHLPHPARGSRARRDEVGADLVGMSGMDFVRIIAARGGRPMPDLSPSFRAYGGQLVESLPPVARALDLT